MEKPNTLRVQEFKRCRKRKKLIIAEMLWNDSEEILKRRSGGTLYRSHFTKVVLTNMRHRAEHMLSGSLSKAHTAEPTWAKCDVIIELLLYHISGLLLWQTCSWYIFTHQVGMKKILVFIFSCASRLSFWCIANIHSHSSSVISSLHDWLKNISGSSAAKHHHMLTS